MATELSLIRELLIPNPNSTPSQSQTCNQERLHCVLDSSSAFTDTTTGGADILTDALDGVAAGECADDKEC